MLRNRVFIALIIFLAMGLFFIGEASAAENNQVEIDATTPAEINQYFANGSIADGDAVYLGNKTYVDSRGWDTNPAITIGNNSLTIYGGTVENPNAFTTFKSNAPLLSVKGKDITFINIRFMDNGAYGQYKNPDISIESDGYIKFVNCSFENMQSGAILSTSCNGFYIVNCSFKNVDASTNGINAIVDSRSNAGDFNVINTTFENLKHFSIYSENSNNFMICNSKFSGYNSQYPTGDFYVTSKGSKKAYLYNNTFANINFPYKRFLNIETGDFVYDNNLAENLTFIKQGLQNAYSVSANNYLVNNSKFNNINSTLFRINATSDLQIINNEFKSSNVENDYFISFDGSDNFVFKNNTLELIVTGTQGNYKAVIEGAGSNYIIENNRFEKINGTLFELNSGNDLTIYNNTFDKITSGNHHSIHFNIDGNFAFKNNTFSNMTTSSILLEGNAKTYLVENSTFTRVNAGLIDFGPGEKCEIYDIHVRDINLLTDLINSESFNTTIRDSSFENLNLTDSAIIEITGHNSTVDNLQFLNCQNGEGIILGANNSTVKNIKFKDFISPTDGGCLVIFGVNDLVDNCTFINCSSSGNGGAVVLTGERNTINNSTFINCSTIGCGGAIAVSGSNNLINGSRFIGNEASLTAIVQEDGGGAIYIGEFSENSIIQHCFFDDNTGFNSGGAMRIAGPGTLVLNCTFLNNYVEHGGNEIQYGGGAIWAALNTINIVNSSFHNNKAPYGGALRGAANVTNCKFINNTATDGNGGGIDMTINEVQVKLPLVVVKDSIFVNNSAWGDLYKDDRSQGGGLHTYWLRGIRIENSTFISNVAARGGGLDLYIVNESYIINNTFTNNSALFGGGSAIISNKAQFRNNIITSNLAIRGAGALIEGDDTEISEDYVAYNMANAGGGYWISGQRTKIHNLLIEMNDAIMGAAIYKFGNSLNMTAVEVHHNTAILNTSSNVTDMIKWDIFEIYAGEITQNGFDIEFTFNNNTDKVTKRSSLHYDAALGGGIYTLGSDEGNSIIDDCLFYHNTARNGSAIYAVPYSMLINNTYFYSNSAWSYALPINFNSTTIRLGEKLKGNVTIIGGDNLINAIYNKNSPSAFQLRNVTYEFFDGEKVVNRTTQTLATPVDGYEKSEGGKVVYQDDRENNQIINITFRNNATGEKVYETSGRSDIAGNVYFETPVLPVGVYTIDAAHYNGIPYHPNRDYYYTDIFNRTNFAVEAEGPYVDVGITKNANETQIYAGETVQWDITVKNNGDSIAENVVLTDILPEGLEFVSASEAGYDKVNGIWTIGTLQAGESKTLTIVTKATKPGSILNKAEVTADNDDNPDNNEANDTVKVVFVDVGVVKEANETKVTTGDLVSWTITVSNLGNGTAKDVVLTDTLPEGLEFLSAEYDVGTYADGVWTIGDLDPNQSVTIVLKTKVVSNAPVNITNIAKATTSSNDTNRDNDESNDTITVEPKMDLAISKEADTKLVYNNTEVTWTITVKNGGPSEAYDVSVSDNLQSGLKFVSSTPSKGTYDDAAGKWTIGTLAAGETVTLTITSLVSVDQFGSITNAAEVTTTSNDTNESNNKANDTIEVVDKTDEDVDLEIRKEVNQTAVRPDGHVSWTITVINNGPNDAKDVKVKDILPTGLEQTSATPSVGTYENGVWDIGDLANGESVTLTINTHVTATDDISITNDAEVNTTSRDTNPDNNKDNATTEVISEVDVAVEKTTPNATAKTGETVEWIITVTNKGPSTARNVRVNDTMPAGMQYVSSDAAAGTYENGVWTIGDLAVNSPVTLKIICKVTSTKEETITNFAEVTTTSNDTNQSNNRDNATVDIVQSHVDVSVEKTANATSVHPGDYVSWTITVKNNGPDKANDVAVNDTLPAGLQFISADTAAGRYENGVWTIGDLEAGQTVTLTIVTEVSETENVNLTNIVVVTTTSNDTNESNNRANDTVEVLPIVDIAVNKAADVDKAVYGDTVTWTVTVTNNGPSKAENVVVSDVLPAGLKYMYSTSDVGSYDHATGNWTVGNLIVGSSAELIIVTEVTAVEKVNITNIAVGETSSNDTNESNNRANDTVEVLPVVDVGVNNVADKDKVVPGDTVTWTVTVINNGPSKAENVVVSDVLPAGLKYMYSTSDVGSYDHATGNWTIGYLEAGQTVILEIVTEVTATEKTNITTVAVVTTTSNDTNESNNMANDTIEVIVEENATDLKVVKTSDKNEYKVGETVKWTIVVNNLGPLDAINTLVHDALPNGMDYLSYSATHGIFDPSTGTWNIGTLAAGEYATLDIFSRATVSGTVTNFANATTDTPETDYDNNYGNRTVVVRDNSTEPVDDNNDTNRTAAAELESPAMMKTGNPIMALLMIFILPLLGIKRRKE